MCNSCHCGTERGCGCCACGLLGALKNLFAADCLCSRSACGAQSRCEYAAASNGFGSCANLYACSDAYYARQYALGGARSCTCERCCRCVCRS